ncbi:acyl-CoA synthetase [Myxococcota bacterium]|nr:acyl-CoA synthetase [Myxococcota bacterium]
MSPSVDLNLAQLHEHVAERIPERECLVDGTRRFSYAEVTERTRRLANFLLDAGLTCRKERSELSPWESGQDHLGLLLYNGPEYVESALAAHKARVAPFNVNYRYVREELRYLFRDASIRGLVFHATFAPMVAGLRSEFPDLDVLIQVPDSSNEPLLEGAIEYEDAIAQGRPQRPAVNWSPDDLYILYTGGTTGMPKGVLWRQADILVAALGGRRPDGGENTLEQFAERVQRGGARSIPAPPLMHGSAQWFVFNQFHAGHTCVFQQETRRLDPDDLWSTAERERCTAIVIVGDAFARPMIDQLDRKSYDLSHLRAIFTGAAVTSTASKRGLIERLPGIRVIDNLGSSETGAQGEAIDTTRDGTGETRFTMKPGGGLLNSDLTRRLELGSQEIGWLAQGGRVPLGYLGDPEKTARTFPTIDGQRYSVPGDRARFNDDGTIHLLGRESMTINSGGEKIFAEEVEIALKRHPAVYDAIVCGRPSERWGNEVVAVLKLHEGVAASDEELRATCAEHVARYKLPKAFVRRDEVRRSPSGKPDYAWAREQAIDELSTT